jgi:predicted DNA-binding ribbon-helix-helix protein
MAADAGRLRKRSVTIAGHRTSLSLESAFWDALKEIAAARALSLNRLIEEIDRQRQEQDGAPNLSSAVRVFVLNWLRERSR